MVATVSQWSLQNAFPATLCIILSEIPHYTAKIKPKPVYALVSDTTIPTIAEVVILTQCNFN